MARLKVLYLVAVSLGVFLVRDPRILALAAVFHLVLAPFAGVRPRQLLRMAWSLRFFLLFLVAMQAVFPPRSHFLVEWFQAHWPTLAPETTGGGSGDRPDWRIGVLTGLYQVAQIFTMVLVSAIIRASRDGMDFLEGMRGLFVPQSAIEVIDACYSQIEKPKDQSGERRNRSAEKGDRPESPIRALLSGDVRWVIDRLEGEVGPALDDPSRDAAARDARLMTRITLVFMSLRMLKITPGTGLTPGYQNVIIVPLLCLAADRTHRHFGATVVGTAAGVLSVMLGFGRNGLFILPAHVLPGLVVDLGWRLFRGSMPGRLGCVVIGVAAGFARFTGMLLVLLLLDNPELLAAVPVFSLGHVVFGALSGTVTYVLVREARERNTQEGCP